TLTALVAGLVATPGAPSRAQAFCTGTLCTNSNGGSFIDSNRNGVQDLVEPTIGPQPTKDPCDYGPGPGCPGYHNPASNPTYYPTPTQPTQRSTSTGGTSHWLSGRGPWFAQPTSHPTSNVGFGRGPSTFTTNLAAQRFQMGRQLQLQQQLRPGL